MRPTAEKVDAIASFPKPKTLQDLRPFLGMINFYGNFVPHALKHRCHSMTFYTRQRKKISGQFRGLSKKFSPAQLKYATYDRELTAVYNAIQHFDYYLENRLFKVYTDHKPLIYAL